MYIYTLKHAKVFTIYMYVGKEFIILGPSKSLA